MNVSNAKRNMPKAIKSLKSRGFLIGVTSSIWWEVNTPVTRKFLKRSIP